VTSIGPFAFAGCTNLTGITIPDSVTSIKSEAFRNCTALTSVTFQGTIASDRFENYVFYGLGDLLDEYLLPPCSSSNERGEACCINIASPVD